MIPDPLQKTVLIPIRVRDGKPQFFYGGDIPRLKEGAIGDLIVPTYAVEDKGKLKILEQESTKEFLPKGTHLFAQLKLEDALNRDADKKPLLRTNLPVRFPKLGAYAEVILNEPLMINLRGTKKAELQDCKCSIPTLPDEKATSVNHAYTLLSVFFEPRRRSHTGNVFDKVYFENSRSQWEPLKVLRNRFEASFERELIILFQPWWHKIGPEKDRVWALLERRTERNIIVHCLRSNSEVYAQYFYKDEEKSSEWIKEQGYTEYKYEISPGHLSQPRPPYKRTNGEIVEFAFEGLVKTGP